jgi:carboxyl-terminal processing protease
MQKKKIVYVALFLLGLAVIGFASREVLPDFATMFETYGIIKSQYVDKTTDDHKLLYGAIRGMLESLGDPYSRYMEPTANSEMKVRLDGEFYGVGIQIGMKTNQLTVIAPIEGTPAYRAGIKSKDKIIKIDGKSTAGMALEDAVSRIRGPKQTQVVLTLIRPSDEVAKEFDIAMIRDVVKLQSITSVQILTPNIGYLRLNTFESKQMMSEFEEAMKKLFAQHAKGLIIDLRDDGGGLLSNAIMSASLFLETGKDIVHTVGRDGVLHTQQALDVRPKIALPLIVLVNENSASASEIFAGAMSDNGRGIVMGSHTFGKASVQNIRELSDKSAVLITIAKYLTPNKTDISKVGIKPDVEIKVPTENIKKMQSPDFIYEQKEDYSLQQAVKMMKEILN